MPVQDNCAYDWLTHCPIVRQSASVEFRKIQSVEQGLPRGDNLRFQVCIAQLPGVDRFGPHGRNYRLDPGNFRFVEEKAGINYRRIGHDA